MIIETRPAVLWVATRDETYRPGPLVDWTVLPDVGEWLSMTSVLRYVLDWRTHLVDWNLAERRAAVHLYVDSTVTPPADLVQRIERDGDRLGVHLHRVAVGELPTGEPEMDAELPPGSFFTHGQIQGQTQPAAKSPWLPADHTAATDVAATARLLGRLVEGE